VLFGRPRRRRRDLRGAEVAVLAGQAIDAMVAINDHLDAAREQDTAPDVGEITAQQHLLRSAAVLGRNATTARATKLERKYHALFARLINRWDDYQRCVDDPAVPWDNAAE
jgi:hypothetical protein